MSVIETILEDLMKLRSNWNGNWNEAKEVALNLMMEIKSSHGSSHVDRTRKWMHSDTSTTEANMAEVNDTDDFPEEANVAKKLAENFDILWEYPTMCVSELEKKAKKVSSSISQTLMMKILKKKCNIYQLYTRPILDNQS